MQIRYFVFLFTTMAMTVLLPGCNQSSDQLDTDLVNNPLSAEDSLENTALPVIDFGQKEYDFGEISQGEVIQYAFTFTNTGEGDLIIKSAKGDCGCTVPEWPKKPIKPGENGEILVKYDSDGHSDRIHKVIRVVSNAQGTTVLTMKGFVVGPEAHNS